MACHDLLAFRARKRQRRKGRRRIKRTGRRRIKRLSCQSLQTLPSPQHLRVCYLFHKPIFACCNLFLRPQHLRVCYLSHKLKFACCTQLFSSRKASGPEEVFNAFICTRRLPETFLNWCFARGERHVDQNYPRIAL